MEEFVQLPLQDYPLQGQSGSFQSFFGKGIEFVVCKSTQVKFSSVSV